jgi:imidazolonepropionase-like amidohydrolase
MANIAYLRERFTQARLYRKDCERFRALAKPKPGQRPDYDAGLEILADVLEGEVRVQVHCYTRSDIEALLRLADEMKFQVAAIHHALEAYKVAPLLAEKGVGVCTWADWWGFKQEAVDGIPANASICTQSGVVVAIHSDSASDIQRLPHEAAKAVRAGLSPEDAIRAITLNAAKILGIDGQVGSIEVGKQADFAVFTKHPLDAFARCDLTVVDGQVVYDRAIAEAAQALAREALTIPLERAPAPGFLIGGATVHPVSSPPFENGFVVVQEGRITHAGPDMPEDARDLIVVNAMGLHVYPGLIDTGCQVGLVEVSSDPNLNESGSARLFAADTRVTDGLNPDSRTIAVARSTGVTTALIVPGGNPIAGLGAVIDLEGPTAASMIARDAAVLSVNLTGRTRGRARGEKKGGTRTELLRELRREFHEALRHKEKIEAYERKKARYEAKQAERARKAESKGEGENPDSESNEDPDGEEDKKKDEEKEPPTAPDRKPHLDAMLLALSGEIPVLVSAHTAHDIQLALSLADEFSLRLILSQGTEAYRMREQLAERKIPITFGPFTTQPSRYETRNAIYESPALLHEAGILFSLRTGSSHNVARLPSHAGLTVAYGLPEEAALRAITLDAAKVLGIDEDYGSIEVGKIANLVVTDGDILQPTTQVKRLFIRGREVGLSSHQSELGDRYRTK